MQNNIFTGNKYGDISPTPYELRSGYRSGSIIHDICIQDMGLHTSIARIYVGHILSKPSERSERDLCIRNEKNKWGGNVHVRGWGFNSCGQSVCLLGLYLLPGAWT